MLGNSQLLLGEGRVAPTAALAALPWAALAAQVPRLVLPLPTQAALTLPSRSGGTGAGRFGNSL